MFEVYFFGKQYKKFVLETSGEKIDFLILKCNSVVFVSTLLRRQLGASEGEEGEKEGFGR